MASVSVLLGATVASGQTKVESDFARTRLLVKFPTAAAQRPQYPPLKIVIGETREAFSGTARHDPEIHGRWFWIDVFVPAGVPISINGSSLKAGQKESTHVMLINTIDGAVPTEWRQVEETQFPRSQIRRHIYLHGWKQLGLQDPKSATQGESARP